MRNWLVSLAMVTAVASGCGNKNKDKQDPAGTGSSGSSGSSAAAGSGSNAPVACAPGEAIDAATKACRKVVTADNVAAVAQEQTRLDDLGKMIDKADVIAATVELVDGLRKQDAWKQLASTSDKFKVVDDIAQVLADGVKQLHAFRASLNDASTKLGDLKSTLDKTLKETGADRKLEEVRKQVSDQLRAAVAPLQAETIALISKVIVPVSAQLDNASDIIISACTAAKLTGGSDKLKELCAQAKDLFARATVYIADLKTKPAELFAGVTTNLEKQLDALVDEGAKKLIDEAQHQVSEALKLQAGSAGSGSGSAK